MLKVDIETHQQNDMFPIDRKIMRDFNEIVVRIYSDCKNNPELFQKVSVRSDQKEFRVTGDNQSKIYAVLGEDQVEDAARIIIGNSVFTFRDKLIMNQIYRHISQNQNPYWVFNDALGNVIPSATVEIFLCDLEGRRIRIGKFTADRHLEKLFPQSNPHDRMQMFEFIISHPDYGTALVRYFGPEQSGFTMPLVRIDSESGTSAIYGYIVDPENKPVRGARIVCDYVTTLGEGLIDPKPDPARYSTLTDQNGFFNMYMPCSSQRSKERGSLIPLKSKFYVNINAPENLGLLPYDQPIENGKESRIVLERPSGDAHTLTFISANGVISKPDELALIELEINRPSKPRLHLTYDDFKNLNVFPYGTYKARTRTLTSAIRFDFLPVEVKLGSPYQLVFRLPGANTYTGRVINGITGAPMQGIFALAMESSYDNDFITDEQWTLLHGAIKNPDARSPVLAPLRQAYKFNHVVRTGLDGSFTLSIAGQSNFHKILFMEQNFISATVVKQNLVIKNSGPTDVGLVKLFPSAKILLNPVTDDKNPSIWPDWIIDEQGNPDWTSALLKSSLIRGKWLIPNNVNCIYIPAHINLKLRLAMPYNDKLSPVNLDRVFNLDQGQTLDLGQIALQPSIELSARVIDSNSQPIEGVPVSIWVKGDSSTVVHNSDANGIVRFGVPRHCEGEFIITHIDYKQARELFRQTTPFKTESEKVCYTLTLSDEKLAILFGPDPNN